MSATRRATCRMSLVLIASMSMMVGSTPSPASAAAITCAFTGTMTFDPPLGLVSRTGTIHSVNSSLCVQADGTTVTLPPSYAGDNTWTYTGNCAFAIVDTGAFANYIAGGVVGVVVGPSSGGVPVLVGSFNLPDQVCNESSAQQIAWALVMT